MAHNDSIFFWALLYLFSGSLKQRSTSVSEVKIKNRSFGAVFIVWLSFRQPERTIEALSEYIRQTVGLT